MCASAAMLSSLWERTMPGSVRLAISSAVPTLAAMALELDVQDLGVRNGFAGHHGGRRGVSAGCGARAGYRARARHRHGADAGAQRAGHLGSGLKAVFWTFRQRFVERTDHVVGQLRKICADIYVRFIGDL